MNARTLNFRRYRSTHQPVSEDAVEERKGRRNNIQVSIKVAETTPPIIDTIRGAREFDNHVSEMGNRTSRSDSTRCLVDIVARSIFQDGARDDVKEMISPRGERGLVDRPAERRHQGEQIVPIHIGARRSFGLCTEQ
jgi:hypothetical protein